MRVDLEPFVPYHEGLQWRISRAYYAQRGVSAWLDGDLPYLATNSAPYARQQALFFRQIAGEGPLDVLELGAGLGRFAVEFLRELDEAAPDVASRVRYVLSDLDGDNVRRAATAFPDLVESGRLVPAVFDPATGALRTLDDEPIDVRCALVVANYVCDATPVRLFRKDGDAFLELYAKMSAGVVDDAPVDWLARAGEPGLLDTVTIEADWRPADLDERLSPAHAAAIRALTAPFPQATVPWFEEFLDTADRLRDRMAPGGVLVVSDYGTCEASDLAGLQDAVPLRFANATCHGVNLATFDAWAEQVGLAVTRSRVPLQGLHHAAIAYGAADVAEAFEEAFVRSHWGEDLLDFTSAARAHAKAGHHIAAVRMLRRALALDPRSAELHHHLGESCVDAGHAALGMDYLLAGRALGDPQWDFDFQLGRACFDLGRLPEAIAWFRASSDRADHPATRLNLAIAYRDLGEIEAAYAECRESAALDPDYERARALLAELAERLGR